MTDPSNALWSGQVQGRQVEVFGPFEESAGSGPDPTFHDLRVRIDGEEADMDRLEPLFQGDDPQALSLRQALDRMHAR